MLSSAFFEHWLRFLTKTGDIGMRERRRSGQFITRCLGMLMFMLLIVLGFSPFQPYVSRRVFPRPGTLRAFVPRRRLFFHHPRVSSRPAQGLRRLHHLPVGGYCPAVHVYGAVQGRQLGRGERRLLHGGRDHGDGWWRRDRDSLRGH